MLIVDDDIRNVYALTIALEKVEMEIIAAENGYEGIEMLQEKSRHRYHSNGYYDA